MELTIKDIALCVRERYRRAKQHPLNAKKKWADIYDAICRDEFNAKGYILGYISTDYATFKGHISRIIKKFKEVKKESLQKQEMPVIQGKLFA